MISISSNKKLDIILPNTNKALNEVLKSATPKQLETITQNKDLKSVINSLLQESSANSKSDKALLLLLKNNPTLKDLGNVSTTIKDLLNSIKSEKNPLPVQKVLKEALVDIKQLNESSLKSKITNSGVFLESKLKNAQNTQNIKEIISNDLKAVLLQASEEVAKSSHPNQAEILKHMDKLSLQIDYYQLMSHLSNSSSLYLPFSWDALEEGNIKLKKAEDDKFYCDIELKLKEYGELKLRLVLYEENQLNIQIHSDNTDLQTIVKENISLLRSALIESHITPREIRILDATKTSVPSPYENSLDEINVGFEVKA